MPDPQLVVCVWKGLDRIDMLEEEHHWKQALGLKASHPFQFALSAL